MESVVTYLLLCLISVLAGRGFLRLTGPQIEPRVSVYLAPVMTLALWSIVLGIGVSIGVPVKRLWVLIWLLTALLALHGGWQKDLRFMDNEWAWLLIVVLLPVGLMAAYFWYGLTTYLGSPLSDGWSYMAYGQYRWEYPRGTEGGLAPLYQYAAHLNRTRFIASATLGFFSPLVASAGDTQAASGYFLAWILFVFASACMFLAVVKGLSWRLGYVILSGFSGWLLNLLWANNYDNALAISFLPAFAGVMDLVDSHERRWGVVLAGLSAAALYCYPEMALFILVGAGLLLLQRLSSKSKVIREWLILLLGAAGLAAILVVPFAKDLAWFVMNQLNAAMSLRIAKGAFGELLLPGQRLMAFWGFGRDHFYFVNGDRMSQIWDYSRYLLTLALSVLASLGLFELFRRKAWGLAVTIVMLFSGAMLMIFRAAYPYGAYKFILLNWWGMAWAVVVGADLLSTWLPEKRYRWGFEIGLATLLLLFLFVNGFRVLALDRAISQKSIKPFKQVEQIKEIVGDDAVVVAVKNDLANEWAVYFLRDIPIHLAIYRAYMAQRHVVPYMERAAAVHISDAPYVLTDDVDSLNPDPVFFPQTNVLWSGELYSLWQLPRAGWILVNSVRNANGIEDWEGEPGLWLGQGDTEIHLIANRDGRVGLSGHFVPGPSLPETSVRRLMVRTDRGYEKEETFIREGVDLIFVPVAEGTNTIVLHTLDKPTVAQLPNGDTRPLLLGVKGLRVESLVTDENPAAIASTENPNGVEQTENGEQFFWIGRGDTMINVVSYKAGTVALEGYFLPGPSLPETGARRLLVSTDQGYEREEVFTGEGDGVLSVPVVEGINRIVLHPMDEPTVQLPNDPRPLLLGVQGMHIGGFFESPETDGG